MHKLLILILVLGLYSSTQAQKITFFTNAGNVKFLDSKGDTLSNPFAGGMGNPTFSNIDLNFDGINDLFLFDHADSTVATFINDGKGNFTYAPEYINYFPSLIRWAFLRDYNKDGLPDIFAYTHQQGGVEVYKNISSGGQLKFTMANPYLMTSSILCNCINSAQVYWDPVNMPSIADMDNDGDLDILAVDPSGYDVYMYKNRSYEKFKAYDSLWYEQTDDYWGAFQTAGGSTPSADSFAHIPKIGLNYSTHCHKQKHAGCNLTAFDADGDGDMDIIYTDINGSDPMLLVNGKVEKKAPFDTIISVDTAYLRRMRFFPGAFNVDIDNDGVRDLLISPQQYQIDEAIKTVQYYHNDGKDNAPKYTFKDDNFLNGTEVDLGNEANPAFLDRNGDGIPEYLAIATAGNYNTPSDRLVLYQNIGSKGAPVFKVVNNDWLSISSKNIYGLSPAFGDIDGDGLMDLVLGKGDGKLLYYHNKGNTTADNFVLEANPFITDSIYVGNYSTPAIADLDKDGKADILVGNVAGKIAYYKGIGSTVAGGKSYIGFSLENAFFGNIITDDPTDTSTGRDAMSAPLLVDLNRNGNLDLVSGSASGTLYIFMDIQGHLNSTLYPEQNFLFNPKRAVYETRNFGARVHPAAALLNSDSLPDLIIGNQKGGLYYYGSHTIISNVAIETPQLENLKVFPNPAEQTFTIQSNIGIRSYTLFNLTGQSVLHFESKGGLQQLSVDVSNLPEGMYILNVTGQNDENKSLKLVKNR